MKTKHYPKIYTLRHFLFYMGVTWVVSMIVMAGSELLELSYGLSITILIVVGLVVPMIALRESLFAPVQPRARQRPGRQA